MNTNIKGEREKIRRTVNAATVGRRKAEPFLEGRQGNNHAKGQGR